MVESFLRKVHHSGNFIIIDAKRYTVHRMNYGAYFLQPEGWKGGERDGFAPGTLWLKPCGKEHEYGPGYVLDTDMNS